MNINWTIVGQSVTFFVVIWFCWKFIWPPLIDAMRERQKTIADGLAAAEQAEKDLELAQERADAQLKEAKQEAQGIIDATRSRANQMIEEAKSDARAEGERLKEAALAEIDQEINRAKEALRAQVAALALTGAEKVLGATIDAEKHSEILNQLAAEL
ncbi:MAG: F0F1 ATP synthase subunit B [Gammaproteobacteria bacterium]|nr:F0F1 ATP synthase subunit B [Gammaproteobacteria bacterium]